MTVVVFMGPSGAGKTTLARAFAARRGWSWLDADDLHAPDAVEQMRGGSPLTDAQRAPWLARVAAWIDAERAAGRSCSVACSALRRTHRDALRSPDVAYVQLDADVALLERRLARRRDHFMPPELAGPQLALLESIAPDERGLQLPADLDPEEQFHRLERFLAGDA